MANDRFLRRPTFEQKRFWSRQALKRVSALWLSLPNPQMEQ